MSLHVTLSHTNGWGRLLYDSRGHKLEFQNDYVFLPLGIVYISANDEMPHYATFHQGLNCLPKYLFYRFPVQKWLTLCLLALSADNFCKQFGPGSGPTFCKSTL